MAYSKTNWTETTEITIARLNNLETQYEKALVDARAASWNPLYAEIVYGKGSPGTRGRLVFDLVDNNFYVDNGSAWIKVSPPTQRTGHVTAQGFSVSGTTLRFRPQEGYYPGDAGNSVQLSDVDFVATNIRNGKNIFGVTGTYTGYSLKASTNLRLSANNERSTQNTTPTKLKEITMGVGGTVRVTHRLRGDGGYYVRSQVYLNGAPIGQEHEAGYAWETKTDALLFCAPGDKLQLYAWTQSSSDTAYVDNFRVYYNEVTDTEHFINLD